MVKLGLLLVSFLLLRFANGSPNTGSRRHRRSAEAVHQPTAASADTGTEKGSAKTTLAPVAAKPKAASKKEEKTKGQPEKPEDGASNTKTKKDDSQQHKNVVPIQRGDYMLKAPGGSLEQGHSKAKTILRLLQALKSSRAPAQLDVMKRVGPSYFLVRTAGGKPALVLMGQSSSNAKQNMLGGIGAVNTNPEAKRMRGLSAWTGGLGKRWGSTLFGSRDKLSPGTRITLVPSINPQTQQWLSSKLGLGKRVGYHDMYSKMSAFGKRAYSMPRMMPNSLLFGSKGGLSSSIGSGGIQQAIGNFDAANRIPLKPVYEKTSQMTSDQGAATNNGQAIGMMIRLLGNRKRWMKRGMPTSFLSSLQPKGDKTVKPAEPKSGTKEHSDNTSEKQAKTSETTIHSQKRDGGDSPNPTKPVAAKSPVLMTRLVM